VESYRSDFVSHGFDNMALFWRRRKRIAFALKMRCNRLVNSAFQNFVELAGVEPASKRGSHMVSTCLSLPWFSDAGWIRATDLQLISLTFTCGPEHSASYPSIAAPPDPDG